jgi:hypothetical protein
MSMASPNTWQLFLNLLRLTALHTARQPRQCAEALDRQEQLCHSAEAAVFALARTILEARLCSRFDSKCVQVYVCACEATRCQTVVGLSHAGMG